MPPPHKQEKPSPVPLHDCDVTMAATVICLRKTTMKCSSTHYVGASSSSSSSHKWEVLLGQNEVKNWLRSTPNTTHIMRYPGEWKFPGGAHDPHLDKSLKHTALRELKEEFLGVDVDIKHFNARLLSTKLTRKVRGKRHLMYNFVALQEENPWLAEETLLNVSCINDNLQRKRDDFRKKLRTGEFWTLNETEKENLSPEVKEVRWMDLEESIDLMGTSMAEHYNNGTTVGSFVNDWQKQQFETYGVVKRDPMYMTQRILLDILELNTTEAIIKETNKFQDTFQNDSHLVIDSMVIL